jgi:predicted flap endonuclease-1-like 5' DNA nuclease
MSLLFRIVYATHANGTHHKLALDGVRRLAGTDAERWQRLFLKHAELLMQGSKAPDNEFKDFKNHVLHPGDDYWGGAPEKVASWYALLVDTMRAGDWPQVAWCAGVLSHYYTDPIHPFHTGQSEAENAIHRAVEWSINRAYDGLLAEGEAANPLLDVAIPSGPDWIHDLVCQGADTSHRYYERLIAHYDITRGVVEPPAGLDAVSRRLVGELLVYASRGFARLLERAIDEAAVSPPDVSLTVETVLAGLKVPMKWITKKLTDAEDRRIVEAMYDELKATGKVDATLPEDDRMVRDLHAKEVALPKAAARAAARKQRLPAHAIQPSQTRLHAITPAAAAGLATSPPMPRRMPSAATTPTTADDEARREQLSLRNALAVLSTAPRRAEPPPAPPLPSPQVAAAAPEEPAHAATTPETPPALPELRRGQHADSSEANARFHLALGDEIEAAPSIGPKTAERLIAIGLVTVADLLAADPGEAAMRVGARHITPETIADWQDQARLVMSVPGLRGTHAQLLVGAGFRSAEAIASAEPTALSAAVLRFATTREGERVLRSGDPPDIERIKTWIESAAIAVAA